MDRWLVDGSPSEWVDTVAELESYRSTVSGVLLRHVLEHNHGWRRVLGNACASATWRMAVVIFTPLGDRTRDLTKGREIGPRYSFCRGDLAEVWRTGGFYERHVNTVATETVFLLERPPDGR